jgi:hypothetical protein
MKVSILSNRRKAILTISQIGGQAEVAQAIKASVVDEIGERTLREVSEADLKRLAEKIQQYSNTEALKIFAKAITIIRASRTLSMKTLKQYRFGQTREAFSAATLNPTTGSAKRFKTLPNSAVYYTGSVQWRDLSPNWIRQKQGRSPQGYNRFFIDTGDLIADLQARQSRLLGGGIRARVLATRSKKAPSTSKMVLGRISIHMFPTINPALIPMLTSNRWTSSNNGDFERSVLGVASARKLAGPEGYHRALLLPIFQFWLAFRIPRSIEFAVDTWMTQDAKR